MNTKVRETQVPELSTLIAGVRKASAAGAKSNNGPRTRVAQQNESDPNEGEAHVAPQPRAPPLNPDPEHGAMTMTEFCERYKIDRGTLYHMRREGIAPDVVLIGRKVLITYAAAREWERRMVGRTREATADANA
ncbi:hypothetical protein [Paraburkholderia sp. BR10882]|uniref:hypothetical protein n=1 Tax=unclassified Paraburkholderia TaxID=2615204 RepID=UPI0034CF9153